VSSDKKSHSPEKLWMPLQLWATTGAALAAAAIGSKAGVHIHAPKNGFVSSGPSLGDRMAKVSFCPTASRRAIH
jgi:hypothetical protein